MNYYERIQNSITYLEKNLKDHIEIDKASQCAFMSLSNYYRMFFSLTGHTVKEYIRQRRLSLASFDLIYSNKNILEIALDYDFDNGDSFARAFKKVTGFNPSTFRKLKKQYLFERIDMRKMYYDNSELAGKYPEIRVLKEISAMRVACFNFVGKSPEEHAFKMMSKWLRKSGLKMEKDKLRIFGFDNPCPSDPTQEYGYEVCVTIPDGFEVKGDDVQEKELSGGLYAVQGVDVVAGGDGHEIIEAWKRFNKWLKTSKYELGAHQWLEEHLNFNSNFEHVSGMDLYLPIVLKK